jgi:hypothetical protein
MQVSPTAKLDLIQPLSKNQQLTRIALQKTVRTIDEGMGQRSFAPQIIFATLPSKVGSANHAHVLIQEALS